MKKNILYCFMFLALCISCKKGKDDPFVSLRSRKARLTGEWHLKSGALTLTYKKTGRSDYRDDYTFTENAYTVVRSANGATFSGIYKCQISFSKDGSFSFLQLLDNYNVSGNGSWDFLKGVGEYKNKERISFKAASIGGGSYWIDMFNKSKNYFVYNITELREDKLVLETPNELMDAYGDDSTSYYVTSKYTFEK